MALEAEKLRTPPRERFCTCRRQPCKRHIRPEDRPGDDVWEGDDAVLDKAGFLSAPPRVVNLEHGALDLDTGVLRVFIPGKVMITETLQVGKKDEDYVAGVDSLDDRVFRPPWSVVLEAKARIAKWM